MFRFKLESLLNHRKYIEDVVQKELASIGRLVEAEKNRLKKYKENEKNSQTMLVALQQESHTPNEVIIYQKFLIKIAAEINQQEKILKNVQKEYDLKQLELIKAVKKRKTLDKLKDKAFKKYIQNELKKERDIMNEVAGNQFHRKK